MLIEKAIEGGKTVRQWIFVIMTIVLTAGMSMPALAEENVYESDREGSLHIDYRADLDGEIPIEGAQFRIYRVGEVVSKTGEKQIGNEVRSLIEGVEFTLDDDPGLLADRLSALEEDELPEFTAVTTDAYGSASDTHLKPGIYLVVENEPADGYSASEPFWLSLPYIENSQWIYDAEAEPKATPNPSESPKPSATLQPVKEEVQTGDAGIRKLKRMMILMTVSMLGCVCIRIMLYKEGK